MTLQATDIPPPGAAHRWDLDLSADHEFEIADQMIQALLEGVPPVGYRLEAAFDRESRRLAGAWEHDVAVFARALAASIEQMQEHVEEHASDVDYCELLREEHMRPCARIIGSITELVSASSDDASDAD